jgi:hypothetical protein
MVHSKKWEREKRERKKRVYMCSEQVIYKARHLGCNSFVVSILWGLVSGEGWWHNAYGAGLYGSFSYSVVCRGGVVLGRGFDSLQKKHYTTKGQHHLYPLTRAQKIEPTTKHYATPLLPLTKSTKDSNPRPSIYTTPSHWPTQRPRFEPTTNHNTNNVMIGPFIWVVYFGTFQCLHTIPVVWYPSAVEGWGFHGANPRGPTNQTAKLP